MDITQIVLGTGAVLGIIVVCVLAIVPTVLDFTSSRRESARSQRRHLTGVQTDRSHHRSGRTSPRDRGSSVDLAA